MELTSFSLQGYLSLRKVIIMPIPASGDNVQILLKCQMLNPDDLNQGNRWSVQLSILANGQNFPKRF